MGLTRRSLKGSLAPFPVKCTGMFGENECPVTHINLDAQPATWSFSAASTCSLICIECVHWWKCFLSFRLHSDKHINCFCIKAWLILCIFQSQMGLFLFKMTTLNNKMTSLSPWVSSIRLKLQCCVLNVIGMHMQFPAADEKLNELRKEGSFFFLLFWRHTIVSPSLLMM